VMARRHIRALPELCLRIAIILAVYGLFWCAVCFANGWY
jgi:hypothetical protein